MFNIHSSYYANFYICVSTLNNTIMKYDKKLIYRKIVQLQLFRNCYMCLQRYPHDKLFEVTKYYTDLDGFHHKDISYLIWPNEKPELSDMGLYSVDLTLLDDSRINSLISQCKEFGIL